MAKADDPHLQKHKEEVLKEGQTHTAEGSGEQHDISGEKKEEQKNTKAFSQLLKKSDEVLIRMKTVFPLDLFPDTLTVDPLKVNYKCNIFFASGYAESIPITNITDVVVESSVFFAALRISFANYPSTYLSTQILVKPLWKKDAVRARDIIAGLIQTDKQHVDLTNTPRTDAQKLQKLGDVHE